MTIHLRPYQEQALEAEAQHRVEHPDETRLAIVMATGLGKTIVMAERARRFLDEDAARKTKTMRAVLKTVQPDRVLLLVHTDELAQQAEAKVRLIVQGDREHAWSVGVVKAERDEVDADIIIGSVQTLINPERRARIEDVGLVLVDECHHATAASYQAIMRHFGCLERHNGYHRCDQFPPGEVRHSHAIPALGFTATLERSDGQGLGSIWQNVVFTRDISWGVRHGYLVQPIGHRLEIDFTELPDRGHHILTESSVQLDHALVEALAPEKIVEKWIELAKGRPTVAFMPLVRSAKALTKAFQDAGIKAQTVYGDMPPLIRRAILNGYEDGFNQVIVNAMVLTEGWDSPRTTCVIVGRPTKSRSLFVQMAGRGLRPQPGVPSNEQDCILITVADATTDLCSIADLSDRPLDRRMQGALTAMEDQWNIGRELDEQERQKLWTGQVDAREFDPLVTRSSKVWRTTEHGTPFLPISKDGEYIFIVGTSVFEYRNKAHVHGGGIRKHAMRLHKDLPDLELAMTVAEDEAQERGGDLGKLLADKNRAWRKAKPSVEMIQFAQRIGLGHEADLICNDRRSGKAGKLSDLIAKVQATRALEPMVARIKEKTA